MKMTTKNLDIYIENLNLILILKFCKIPFTQDEGISDLMDIFREMTFQENMMKTKE